MKSEDIDARTNKKIILDASVAIKFFIKEEGSEAALELLAEILNEPRNFFVPELFFYEVANTLYRLVGREDARIKLFDELCQLGIVRITFSPELAQGIRKFQQLGLSGYDGAYAALAELLGGEWITADKKAQAKIAHLGISRGLQ